MHSIKKTFGWYLLAGLLTLQSCKPVIHAFSVTNNGSEVRKMAAGDSLAIQYKVSGSPTLLFHQLELDGKKVSEFTLLAERAGKATRQLIQVELLPDTTETTISFLCRFNATKDSLVAAGIKNPEVWGNGFVVKTVSNASGRLLTVVHSNVTAVIGPQQASNLFSGTPVEGKWILSSGLTKEEQTDHSRLPEQLQIRTSIQQKL